MWDKYLYGEVEEDGQGDCMWKCLCSCNCVVECEMIMKGREKVKPGAGPQPTLLKKHQGGCQA